VDDDRNPCTLSLIAKYRRCRPCVSCKSGGDRTDTFDNNQRDNFDCGEHANVWHKSYVAVFKSHPKDEAIELHYRVNG
jgi:hypothetical protein